MDCTKRFSKCKVNVVVQAAPARKKKRKVADLKYYQLLDIEPDVTDAEIKKAYYKQARECHPDKKPGDAIAPLHLM